MHKVSLPLFLFIFFVFLKNALSLNLIHQSVNLNKNIYFLFTITGQHFSLNISPQFARVLHVFPVAPLVFGSSLIHHSFQQQQQKSHGTPRQLLPSPSPPSGSRSLRPFVASDRRGRPAGCSAARDRRTFSGAAGRGLQLHVGDILQRPVGSISERFEREGGGGGGAPVLGGAAGGAARLRRAARPRRRSAAHRPQLLVELVVHGEDDCGRRERSVYAVILAVMQAMVMMVRIVRIVVMTVKYDKKIIITMVCSMLLHVCMYEFMRVCMFEYI